MKPQPQNLPEILQTDEIYVLFGGPSLKGFDLSRLNGKTVIACNKSAELFPAQVVISIDPTYINTRCKFLRDYPGLVALGYRATEFGENQKPNDAVIGGIEPDYLYWHDKRFPDRMSTNPSTLYGQHTGHAAINFLMLQGFKTVHALGLDLNVTGHWHGGYTHSNQHKEWLLNWAAHIDGCKGQLDEAGIRMINYNPNSAVKEYEFSSLDRI